MKDFNPKHLPAFKDWLIARGASILKIRLRESNMCFSTCAYSLLPSSEPQ